MTPVQLTTLGAAIRADTDPAVVAALAAKNYAKLAELYNAASTFIVWRQFVPVDEYRGAIVWTEVDALTVGKARTWEWLTESMMRALETCKPSVIAGLQKAWSSTNTTKTLAALLIISKRPATKAEKLTAMGIGTTEAPGWLGWEGMLSTADVTAALA